MIDLDGLSGVLVSRVDGKVHIDAYSSYIDALGASCGRDSFFVFSPNEDKDITEKLVSGELQAALTELLVLLEN